MKAIFERLTDSWTSGGIVSGLDPSKEVLTERTCVNLTLSVLGSKASKENTFNFSDINITSINRFRLLWSRLFISSFAGGFIWQDES